MTASLSPGAAGVRQRKMDGRRSMGSAVGFPAIEPALLNQGAVRWYRLALLLFLAIAGCADKDRGLESRFHDRSHSVQIIGPGETLLSDATRIESPTPAMLQKKLRQAMPSLNEVGHDALAIDVLQQHCGLRLVWPDLAHVWREDARGWMQDETYASLFRSQFENYGEAWRPTLSDFVAAVVDTSSLSGDLRPPCWDPSDPESEWVAERLFFDPFAMIVGDYLYIFPVPIEPCGTWE